MRKKKEPKLNEELEQELNEDLEIDPLESSLTDNELEASELLEDDDDVTEVLETKSAKPRAPKAAKKAKPPAKTAAVAEEVVEEEKEAVTVASEKPKAPVKTLAAKILEESAAELSTKSLGSVQDISQSISENLERVAKQLQAMSQVTPAPVARPSSAAKFAFVGSAIAIVLSVVSLSLAQSARQDAVGQALAAVRNARTSPRVASSAPLAVAQTAPAVEAPTPAPAPVKPVAEALPSKKESKEIAKRTDDTRERKASPPIDNPRSDDIAKVIESMTRKHRTLRGKKEVR